MSGGEVVIGYLIVGAANLIVGVIVGFKVGLKKGKEIIDDLTRRKNEAESLLLDVRTAASKGRGELMKVSDQVKEHVEKIFGEGGS